MPTTDEPIPGVPGPDVSVPTDAPFLDRLDPATRDDLFAVGTRRRYPANSTIFMIGEAAHEVLVVLDGRVKAVVPALDGRQVILDVLGRGALLGELASLDGGERSASIETLGPVEVLAIRYDDYRMFLIAHPEVLHHMTVVIARRLRASVRRQFEFGTGDALGRMCGRLLELAERYGTTADDGVVQIESPLSQADLASWSGLSREAVVKAMRSLRTLGWVRNDGRSITIVEPDRLRERSET